MVVQKVLQCRCCRNWMDFYVEERESLKGKQVVCKDCGIVYTCVHYNYKLAEIAWKQTLLGYEEVEATNE